MPFQNSNPNLPLTGRNVAVTVFINGSPQPQTDLCKSVTVTEVVVQYRDKYMGRDRDRTDEQTIGWDAKMELDYASEKLVAALLQQKEARRQNQPVPTISLGLTLQNRDGTAAAYILQNCTTKLEIGFRGKDDRTTISLDIQAEDLVQRTL